MPPDELPDLGSSEADRSTLLAEIAGLGSENDEQLIPDDTADLSEDSEPDEAATEEAEAEPEVEETPEVAPDEAEEPATEPEPDSALEKMQQAEKRSKERMSAHMSEERTKLAAEQEKWKEQLAESDKILADQTARARRSFDPEGKSSEDLMAEARRLHALSKAAGPDGTPADRAVADRMSRDRSVEERLAAAEKRADDAEALYKADKEEVANKAQAEKFTDHLVSGITDETPFVKRLLEGKGKAKAREKILHLAAALHSQTGENPDAIDVFKIYEESERALLEERGIDPDAVLKATAKKKKKNPAAGEKKSATTLGNDQGNSTQPRTDPLTEKEERDDILKGMAGL